MKIINVGSSFSFLAIRREKIRKKGRFFYNCMVKAAFRRDAGFSMNDNTLEQIECTTDYVKDANKLTYPANVPYFKIISRQTYEAKNNQIKIAPQEYQQQHLARIGAQAKYEILDGTHFIYLKNVERIFEIADEFLSGVNQ